MKGGVLFIVAGVAGAGYFLYKEGFFKDFKKNIIRSGTSSGGSTTNNFFIPASSPTPTAPAGNPDLNTSTQTSTNIKTNGVTIGAANIPTSSTESSFNLSAISRSSGGSVNAIYTGSGNTANRVQRVTYNTNTGKVTNAQSISSGVVANEFGGFSPVENGKVLPMSVPAPTN